MEPIEINYHNDTIAAISTPPGKGGIAVIRVSGPEALKIVNEAWSGKDLEIAPSHSAHLGKYSSKSGNILDEAVVTIFRAPNSYTGEDTAEISVHGSTWIQREVLADLINRGVKMAAPGEFTQRAFLNGKMDLAQAEGVADLISASSKAAHDMAMSQTKGSFSKEFQVLRDKLIEFASLLELELDFSEEDVEFADRTSLLLLLDEILAKVNGLANSFARGQVLKNGVPVAIAGIPNAGKSSLLNLLLGEDKAIVTDIPGTTRDIIEDVVEINGVSYRFFDTAGLRETEDVVENIGVERAWETLAKAYAVIWMIDPTQNKEAQVEKLNEFISRNQDKPILLLINKCDLDFDGAGDFNSDLTGAGDFNSDLDMDSDLDLAKDLNTKSDGKSELDLNFNISPENTVDPVLINGALHINNKDINFLSRIIERNHSNNLAKENTILFSTKTKKGLDELLSKLRSIVSKDLDTENDIIVSNARHYEALTKASQALSNARQNLLSGTPSGFTAQDIREAITHLSSITGSITSTTLLHSIFSRFCIGK